MRSKVYFTAAPQNFSRLLELSGILRFINEGDDVAVKLHFGEDGNTGFVRPEFVKSVCREIIKRKAVPVLTDTNTLYRGRRLDSEGHVKLAYEHGFTLGVAGAPVVIADGNEDVEINEMFIKTARIAPLFLKAKAIVAISHFKGHVMSGFGGALKNLGMGCASREGKLAQHSDVAPFVRLKNCVGCAECEKVCPVGAVKIANSKSQINSSLCIGCASCIAVCPHNAIDVSWEQGAGNIQRKIAEYAKAVLKGKENAACFINFAVKITKECDCLAKDDPRIAPDVGIFASFDPVSVDKACFDAVKQACGKDVFKEAWPQRDSFIQLEYAQSIGIGNLDYELIKL